MIEDNYKILPITVHPDPILRQPGVNLSRSQILSNEIQTLANNMITTMHEANGIGLAAPQISRSLNLLVVDDGQGAEIFINPLLAYKSRQKNIMEEGCLSIPKVYGLVERAVNVWVLYKDLNARMKLRKITKLKARILQHEIDHLRGVLFIDKTQKITHGEKDLAKYEGQRF